MANNIKNTSNGGILITSDVTINLVLALLEVLCEFLEIAIHNILYLRKLYPNSVFRRAQKYGVVIHKCIHPEVNEYITESLKAVQFHCKSNKLRQFAVCVISLGKVIEKYDFDIINLQKDVKE